LNDMPKGHPGEKVSDRQPLRVERKIFRRERRSAIPNLLVRAHLKLLNCLVARTPRHRSMFRGMTMENACGPTAGLGETNTPRVPCRSRRKAQISQNVLQNAARSIMGRSGCSVLVMVALRGLWRGRHGL